MHGTATVESVSLRDRRDGTRRSRWPRTAVFVMIGADPVHRGGDGMLAVDAAGYLLCGSGAAGCDGHLSLAAEGPRAAPARDGRAPACSPPATCAPDATNRVAGAVGDGALAVRFAHEVLAG